MRGKIITISLLFATLFGLLIARLFYWQIIKGSELSDSANKQYRTSEVVTAPRGNIKASDGSYLALRTDAWLVFASPQEITASKSDVANKLAPFFVEEKDDRQALLDEVFRIEDVISKKDAVWVPLKQKVSSETKKNIDALGIKGIGFDLVEDRYYPEASSAAQLLGFVGKDDKGGDVGYFGLEGYYNLALSGKSGFIGREKDA